MNLSDTLAAVESYYLDALDECGAPVCVSLRYIGQTDDLCDCTCSDGQGSLRVSYRLLGPSATFPTLTTAVKAATPAGAIWVEVRVRVMRCWPTGEHTPTEWEDAADGIADDAWCLAKASHQLVCADPKDLALAGCRDVAGYRIEPKVPAGACAGNEVTLYCQLSG